MKRAALALALCAVLAACGTVPTAKTVCVPVKPYTPAEQKQLAAELQALPQGSALAQAIIDYGQMRAAARACAAASPAR